MFYWGDYVAMAIALFTSGFTLGLFVARRAVTQWLARHS
jgi:uncharacterized protein YneF (UPF0154 family)